jgi:hypothetical protein
MAIFQNSLDNRNLDIAKQGTVVEPLTEILDFNDAAFDVVSGPAEGEVLVSINVGNLINQLFKRVATAVDYTTQSGDTYIGVDTTNEVTITLSAGEYEGQTITIKDETGNANSRQITLLPTAPDLIDDQTEVILKVKYIAVQLVYIADNNQWRII